MSELILIILVLGISIVSSVIKKRKKEVIGAETSLPVSDPWADLFDPEPEQTVHIEEERSLYGSELDEEEEVRRLQLTRAKKTIERRKGATGTISIIEDKHEQKDDATEEAATGISSRFNLRDAIIFSEILKPKF